MLQKTSKLMVHVLLALMLFARVSPAAAAPAADHRVETGTASFTIEANQCPELPAGVSVSGSGDSTAIINTRTLRDGSIETRVNNVIKGIATDNNGGSHRFEYQNYSVDTALPSGLHTISMVDTFVLNGPGPNFSVGFNWSWTYRTDTIPPESYWPPAHDLKQISTRGDIFLCDPL